MQKKTNNLNHNNHISNNDSEININISDSKRQNESYIEKNLQTEDFNLSNSEININVRNNASRLSKEISGIYSVNDVSLSHQSVFRNSVISRNPSIVLNKFQFFSNDENEIDNSQLKGKNLMNNNENFSNNNNNLRNSIERQNNLNDIPNYSNAKSNSLNQQGKKYFLIKKRNPAKTL